MRIAIFTDSFLPYICGATFAALNQANALAARGHHVRIYCPGSPHNQPSTSESPELHENVSVKTVPFSVPWSGQPDLNVVFPVLWPTVRDLRRWGAEVVHAHTEWGTGWAGIFAAWRMKLPTVGTFHTFWDDPRYVHHFPFPNWRIVQKAMAAYSGLFYRRCDVTIAPSTAVQAHLHERGIDAVVVSNGMPTPDLLPDEEIEALRAKHGVAGRRTFLYLGRVSYEKSLPLCLTAFKRVLAEEPEARFVMIGDGPDMPRIKGLVRSMELEQQMVLTGAIPHDELIAGNLPRLGDIFVTASETENQPVSILEAMSFGLPIIGPKARGIPELVAPDKNGLLFDTGDVDGLTAHMFDLWRNHDRCAAMAKGALATADEHSIRHSAERLEAIYRQRRDSFDPLKAGQGSPASAEMPASGRTP